MDQRVHTLLYLVDFTNSFQVTELFIGANSTSLTKPKEDDYNEDASYDLVVGADGAESLVHYLWLLVCYVMSVDIGVRRCSAFWCWTTGSMLG